MKGFLAHFTASWRLYRRNRMAMAYGYLFPLMFLGVFWVLYRDDAVPLRRHLGELLTVTILGGACFGLPTTLVSEREQGVWRRYRLTPMPLGRLVASTLAARFGIIVSAGLLQLAVAFAVGMTRPAHPMALAAAFAVSTLAFMGLGLLLAMLADTVPAVQALGQCVFLPMLVIGGVAVPLSSLPEWAQRVANFLPGRYAVEAMQAATTGTNLTARSLQLPALALTGLLAGLAALKLFRWDVGQRFAKLQGKGWLALILAGWLATGALAEWTERAAAAGPAAAALTGLAETAPWKKITAKDIAGLDFRGPSDTGVVAPYADADEEPDDDTQAQVEKVRAKLPTWKPGTEGDELQRVRNLLCVPVMADITNQATERFLPAMVLARLQNVFPKDQLIQILTWIALHPNEGTVLYNVTEVGVEGEVDGPDLMRERSHFYAIKFLARLTGRIAAASPTSPAPPSPRP